MHEDSSEQAHLLDPTDKWPTTECLIALLSERHELLYKLPGHFSFHTVRIKRHGFCFGFIGVYEIQYKTK